jgi:NTE family protein
MANPPIPAPSVSVPAARESMTERSTRPLDLVLEGGGVKGIGLAGAVIELDRAGYTFPRVAGTSAGAIAAALIAALNAAGKPLALLNDIISSVDYPKFMDAGKLRAATNLLLHMGLYDADYLSVWLGDALRQIGVTRFGQLRNDDPAADATLTDAQRYTLVVHTSDISRGRCVRLPWDYPVYGLPDIDELPIVDAVRASMSIPFFFEPVSVKAPAVTLEGVTYEAGTVTWVDGGMLSNFPVEVFDRADGAPSRWDTLGIKLSARQTTVTSAHGVSSVLSESVACLHTLLDNADRYYLTTDKAARTVFVDNAGIKATDFRLSPDSRAELYTNGQQAAAAWITAQQAGSPAAPARSLDPSSTIPVAGS